MRASRNLVMGPLSVLALSAVAAATPAHAATRSCGTETALSRGAVFKIAATGVACVTAKSVAGGWYNVQSQGKSGRVVFDFKRRRWSCRITEHATGTDPGFIPYTSIRCARRSSVVRFKLRS
jgi:hypothetical protein